MTRLLGFTLAVVVSLLLVACGDDDDGDAEEPDEPGLAYVWQTVGRPVDFDRLRELMTDDLRARTEDEALLDEVVCFPTGVITQVTDKRLERDGDTARIIVTHQITGSGTADAPRQVTRVWQFQRMGNDWLISGLPDCPYGPSVLPGEPVQTPTP